MSGMSEDRGKVGERVEIHATRKTRAGVRRPGSRGIALLAVLALVVAACASDGAPADDTTTSAPATTAAGGGDETTTTTTAPVAKGPLTIGMAGSPVSLDPSRASFVFGLVRPLTHAYLTHETVDGTIEPWLAESWEYVDDENQVFEFTLRSDARFADGTPVNADAVSQWLNYFRAEGTGVFVSAMGPIASIEAVDEFTVRMVMEEPNPNLPFMLSENANWGAVSSPASLEDPSVLLTETHGAGPYVLDTSASITDAEYRLVPNEHYFDQSAIHYSEVIIKVISDPNAMLQAARTGQVDVAMGDLSTVDAARDAGLNVLSFPSQTRGLIIGDRGPGGLLGDVRVRQALNYAVDRATIVEGLVGENGLPTSQMRTRDGWDPDYVDYYEFDPERARQLLSDAGYPDGLTLKVLSFAAGGLMGTPLAQAIASYWAEVGVTAEIETPATSAEFVQIRNEDTHHVLFYSVLVNPMHTTYGFALSPDASLNPYDVEDSEMRDLFLAGSRAADPSEYWLDMSRRTVTEAYFVPVLDVPGVIYYFGDNVGGIELSVERPMYSWATEWFSR